MHRTIDDLPQPFLPHEAPTVTIQCRNPSMESCKEAPGYARRPATSPPQMDELCRIAADIAKLACQPGGW
eukprot:9454135-Lingulodinium_polyedra.AAC.1